MIFDYSTDQELATIANPAGDDGLWRLVSLSSTSSKSYIGLPSNQFILQTNLGISFIDVANQEATLIQDIKGE